MATGIKEQLNTALDGVLANLAGDAVTPTMRERCTFGPAKSADLGDFATSAAMVLAKALGKNPFELAEAIAAALRSHPLVASAEAAKPGFVNVCLGAGAFAQTLGAVQSQTACFGHGAATGHKVLIEFVSANPTGPMHLGHLRHAATGDCLARLLAAAGHSVTREFYINDAGVQIGALGRSFRFRCLEAVGAAEGQWLPRIGEDGKPELDEDGEQILDLHFDDQKVQYNGTYLTDFAKEFVKGKSVDELKALTVDEFAWAARNFNLEEIKNDLGNVGVRFDHFVSEKALHADGAVGRALDVLKTSGNTFTQDGALWLKTKDFGDNEDRVIVKTDGEYTYLVPDLAYHHDKYLRGYDRYINVFGADHGGYPPRLRAGISALGHDPAKLDVILLRLVFLKRDGKRVKFSKRRGNFVALADVVREAGPDAARWFILCRSTDSEFEFDLDIALKQTNENPVFKVQYAHARIRTMLAKAKAEGHAASTDAEGAAKLLTAGIEREMIMALGQLPDLIARSAQQLEVHDLPSYLLNLADLWNRYYSMAKTDPSFRILQDADGARRAARLLLADCVRHVIANGLSLLGISAPDSMSSQERSEEA